MKCQTGCGCSSKPGGFLSAIPGCEPPVIPITVGCVHEHVGTYLLCPRHAETALAGKTHCGFCWHADPPHICPQMARVT
jgi:hypothetical protein